MKVFKTCSTCGDSFTLLHFQTKGRPDWTGYVPHIERESPNTPEKPDINISPESSEPERKNGWNRIQEKSPNLAKLLMTLSMALGPMRSVEVRWRK